MTAPAPIRDDELEGLLGWLKPHLPLALAVSGGPDSMALMHLVARWLKLAGPPGDSRTRSPITPVIVLTVDHGLRPESAAESAWVKRQAEALGFAHETLAWTGEKPNTGIQEAARKARYRLIGDFLFVEPHDRGQPPATALAGANAPALVTAHHLDDQAETLLMRLARGSGVDGLAGMATCSTQSGLAVLRPLLGVAKARLVATLEAGGVSWMRDPSNDEGQFERVRLRGARETLEAAGLTNDMLARSAARLQRARAALNDATAGLAARAHLDLHDFTYATLNHEVLAKAPEELRIRLLMRLLSINGGQETPPRLSKVEQLAERLTAGPLPGTTLGGCCVTAQGGAVLICREPGRSGLPRLRVEPGGRVTWDRRFEVRAGAAAAAAVDVAALGSERWAALKAQYRALAASGIPARAAITLPAFRIGGKLLAVPHLGCLEPELRGPMAENEPLLRADAANKHALWDH